MKAKLFGFALALLSVATIGLVQLTTEAAKPGQVGNAPVCKVNVVGTRTTAFTLNGATATVRFNVTGAKNCKVQLSTSAFYAQQLDGKPFDKQILFQRNIKTVSRGSHAMSINIPTISTPKKGCFWQIDLSLGKRVHTPVLAYKHGEIVNCGQKPPTPEPTPSAVCKSLTATKIERTKFRFDVNAEIANGATISGYKFVIYKDNVVVGTKDVSTTAASASTEYSQTSSGDYLVKAVAVTSLGEKASPECVATFTVDKEIEKKPSIDITKHVENEKYKRVGVNVEYSYQIRVKNTGDTDLVNAKVTDTPEKGVLLVSASEGDIASNVWTYTISELKVGETRDFVLKAKVPAYLAGTINNTVCVDTPTIPGQPDDCDEAKVDVSEPKKEVPPTTPPVEETPPTPPVEKETPSSPPVQEEVQEQPQELPTTGPVDTAMQLIGATSLAGAGSYYLASRRERN